MPDLGVFATALELFQSTPGLTVGRCRGVGVFGDDVADVSIHARPHGRAMLRRHCNHRRQHGVSIHARPHGRAMRRPRAAAVRLLAVSIHARPHGRAMLDEGSERDHAGREFQSTPGLTVGRCARPRSGYTATSAFQSTPGLTVGRCVTCLGCESNAAAFQSTPGLTVGRCHALGAAVVKVGLFQSTPGLTVGRCVLERFVDSGGDLVSIHARPHGRAMRIGISGASDSIMFQSTPGLTVGRCDGVGMVRARLLEFQSTPGLTVGRCCADQADDDQQRGFNPRPASRSGDARSNAMSARRRYVSIHARPHGRAMREVGGGGGGHLAVSIHARPHGRAMRGGAGAGAPPHQVSIHARPHGRAMRGGGCVDGGVRVVSIHARPHGRAMPPPRWNSCGNWTFQSTPGLTVGRCAAALFGRPAMPLFQSTPGLTVGRCVNNGESNMHDDWFQSTPGLTVGRCS